MNLFKVWSRDRQIKKFVAINGDEDILLNLIAAASVKMNMNGSTVVLEKDGTEVTEDEILILLKNETFMLLEPGETWAENCCETESKASTLSIVSGISEYENFQNISELDSNQHQPMLIVVPSDNQVVEVPNNNEFPDNHVEQVPNKEAPDNHVEQVTEYTWQNFEIPWYRFPKYFLEECEKGTADRRIVTEIIHVIVDEMRTIKTYIPNMAYRCVSKKLAEKYPLLFLDRDEDGTIIGNGTHSIMSRLQDRGNYLNRPHKRPSIIAENSPVPPKSSKRLCNSKAGCSNWQPQDNNAENEDTLANKQAILKIIDESHPDFYTYLNDTYASQRHFINKINPIPTIKQIREEWPALFKKEAISWHFSKLTSVKTEEIDFEDKYQKILTFTRSKHILSNSDDDESSLKTLTSLGKYFKEDISSFLYKIKLDRMEEKDGKYEFNISTYEPCIVEIETPNEKFYEILVEKVPIGISGPIQQLFITCFQLYFNFDLMYPKNFCVTLEFIQRYIFKIHPDSGSKSKKMCSSKKKVLNLMNKISKIKY